GGGRQHRSQVEVRLGGLDQLVAAHLLLTGLLGACRGRAAVGAVSPPQTVSVGLAPGDTVSLGTLAASDAVVGAAGTLTGPGVGPPDITGPGFVGSLCLYVITPRSQAHGSLLDRSDPRLPPELPTKPPPAGGPADRG